MPNPCQRCNTAEQRADVKKSLLNVFMSAVLRRGSRRNSLFSRASAMLLAASKSLASSKHDLQPLEYPSVRYWSKEINGTRTGGQK